jgi:hypothetical protein
MKDWLVLFPNDLKNTLDLSGKNISDLNPGKGGESNGLAKDYRPICSGGFSTNVYRGDCSRI